MEYHALNLLIHTPLSDLAPPRFGLAPDLFPFAFEYIFVHNLILLRII